MKYLLIQAVIFLLVLHASFAQGILAGLVTDPERSPKPDVNIYLPSLNKGTNTDGLGRFAIKNLQAGSYEVMITSVGYKSQQHKVAVSDNESTLLKITLEEGELVLADVVITDELYGELNTVAQVDLKLRPVNTSQDILRMIPGLFIAQHAGGGKAEQIFLRGFDIDHGTDISLDVDGLPVNMVSHAHGQGYSDLHFLIPEIVGIVDFNKGPYQPDKGNFATAGYASFRTKNSLDQNMIKFEGGRFGTLRNVNGVNVLNKQNGEWRSNAYVATEYFRTNGYFDANQDFNRLNLFGKYNAYYGDKQAVTVGISTFNSRWDASGQVPERAVESEEITRFGSIDPTEGGETSRTNFWVRHLMTRDNGNAFENQIYYSKYDFKLISNFTFFLNDPVNGDQITQSESRNIFGYKGTYFNEVNRAGRTLRTEAGAGFRYDNVDDIHLYRTRSGKQFVRDVAHGDIDETNLYVYISETLYTTPIFSLNAAVRIDHFTFNYIDSVTPTHLRQSISKTVTSPKLNLSYQATQNVNLFVKSGVGFHSNDTRVAVAQRGEAVLPRAYSFDAGGNFKLGDKLLINVAAWKLNLDQEFVYVGDEGIVEPSGKTTRKGIDVSLRYQILNWLYADTDVNLTKPRVKGQSEGQNYIPLAPTFTTIGGLSCKSGKGFNASLRYRYLGNRAANENNSIVAKGYFLLDAVAKYTRKSFEFSLTAENLLNADWNEAQFYTESRLEHETDPVSEIHFTPGTPFFLKAGMSILF